jgi:hypothetical protein
VPQPSQSLGLNLPDSFARYVKIKAHFFKRERIPVFQTEPHFQDFLFPGRERLQHVLKLFLEEFKRGLMRRVFHFLVLDKITEKRIFL